jgi:hypothetical protein
LVLLDYCFCPLFFTDYGHDEHFRHWDAAQYPTSSILALTAASRAMLAAAMPMWHQTH